MTEDKDRLERIATAAMQGIISGTAFSGLGDLADRYGTTPSQALAKGSVDYARALIAEIDKESDT